MIEWRDVTFDYPRPAGRAPAALAATLMYVAAAHTPLIVLPPVDAWPQVTLLAMTAALVGLVGAAATPLPERQPEVAL